MLALWITESGKSKGQSSVEEYPLMKKSCGLSAVMPTLSIAA